MLKGVLAALALAGISSAESSRLPKPGPGTLPRPTSPLVLRFIRERVIACGEPKSRLVRSKPACRATRRGVAGEATVELSPLPDPRRDIFRDDDRKAVVLHLRAESRPAEQSVKLAQGPWLLSWRGTNKSVHLDIEADRTLVILATVLGECKSRAWRCKLDSLATLNRIELRDVSGS